MHFAGRVGRTRPDLLCYIIGVLSSSLQELQTNVSLTLTRKPNISLTKISNYLKIHHSTHSVFCV